MRPRTRMGICTLEDSICPDQDRAIVMELQGIRVVEQNPQKVPRGYYSSRDGIKITQRFGMKLDSF